MSRPTDPTRSGAPGSMPGTQHEIRRQGRVLGLEYDAGIRITELTGPEMEACRPPLLTGPRRLALPGAPELPDAAAPDEIGRWEPEGGK